MQENIKPLFKDTKSKGSKELKWDWEKSINFVAKYFDTTWEAVLDWNIVNFMYKSAFIQNEIAEESLKKR